MQTASAGKKSSTSNRIPGWTSRLGHAKRTTLSPTDRDTRGHAPASASLHQRRATQTDQSGVEHIGSVRVEEVGLALTTVSV